MKKEEAFKAMESGAIISHITWKDGQFIRMVDKVIADEVGDDNLTYLINYFSAAKYGKGWFIVRKNDNPSSYQAEQLLKQIPLHLEDPNRVWSYSGHEAEPAIAKAIRALHDEVKRLEGENARLKNGVEFWEYGK